MVQAEGQQLIILHAWRNHDGIHTLMLAKLEHWTAVTYPMWNGAGANSACGILRSLRLVSRLVLRNFSVAFNVNTRSRPAFRHGYGLSMAWDLETRTN